MKTAASTLVVGNGDVAAMQDGKVVRQVQSHTGYAVRTLHIMCHIEPLEDMLFVLIADTGPVVGDGNLQHVFIISVLFRKDVERNINPSSVLSILHCVGEQAPDYLPDLVGVESHIETFYRGMVFQMNALASKRLE